MALLVSLHTISCSTDAEYALALGRVNARAVAEELLDLVEDASTKTITFRTVRDFDPTTGQTE